MRFERTNDPTWEQVSLRAALNMGQTVPVTVQRDGQPVETTLNIVAPRDADDFSIASVGLVPLMQTTPVVVHAVEPASPAARAGMKAGDKILSVDGKSLHSASAILAYLKQVKGSAVNVRIASGNATREARIQPEMGDVGDGSKALRLGFAPEPPPFKVEDLPLPAAMAQSAQFNLKYSGLLLEVLHRMVTRHMAVQNLSGPIGIARETGLAATQPGWQPIIGLMTIISLNLGIFNLLPIPILDGGVILLLLIESVLRRDLNQQFKERIYQAAFVLLLLFAAFVMINDISKLSLLPKVKP